MKETVFLNSLNGHALDFNEGTNSGNFSNSITQEEKFHWDAYYAERISFWVDVKIIRQTLVSVVSRKNINTEQSYSNKNTQKKSLK